MPEWPNLSKRLDGTGLGGRKSEISEFLGPAEKPCWLSACVGSNPTPRIFNKYRDIDTKPILQIPTRKL